MAKLGMTQKSGETNVAEIKNSPEPVLQTFEMVEKAGVTPIPEAVTPVASAYPQVAVPVPQAAMPQYFPPVLSVQQQRVSPAQAAQAHPVMLTPELVAHIQSLEQEANRIIEIRVRENIPRTYIVDAWYTFTKMKPTKVPMYVRDWLLEKNLI